MHISFLHPPHCPAPTTFLRASTGATAWPLRSKTWMIALAQLFVDTSPSSPLYLPTTTFAICDHKQHNTQSSLPHSMSSFSTLRKSVLMVSRANRSVTQTDMVGRLTKVFRPRCLKAQGSTPSPSPCLLIQLTHRQDVYRNNDPTHNLHPPHPPPRTLLLCLGPLDREAHHPQRPQKYRGYSQDSRGL